MIRQLGAGAYTYLPLGLRVLHKAIRIVREEMDAAGADRDLMPALQPIELWKESGRFETYRRHPDEADHQRRPPHVPWARPTRRSSPTWSATCSSSYKQLPITLYQIQTKFRDEPRPRFGIVRTREFIMKDAYSFDADVAQLNASYDAMYEAYCRIFDRCGLPYVIVEAESGPIGGDASHEFMVPCSTGEDTRDPVPAAAATPPTRNAPRSARVDDPARPSPTPTAPAYERSPRRARRRSARSASS